MRDDDANGRAPAMTVEPSAGEAVSPAGSDPVDALMATVAAPVAEPPAGALRAARVVAVDGRAARIAWRGARDPVEADVAPEVEIAVVRRAMAEGALVLAESAARPTIVGVLQTRMPDEVKIHAKTVEISAEREIVLRSGVSALRLRDDGDVEIVGSRISAASRGLFRLVGRILRLN